MKFSLISKRRKNIKILNQPLIITTIMYSNIHLYFQKPILVPSHSLYSCLPCLRQTYLLCFKLAPSTGQDEGAAVHSILFLLVVNSRTFWTSYDRDLMCGVAVLFRVLKFPTWRDVCMTFKTRTQWKLGSIQFGTLEQNQQEEVLDIWLRNISHRLCLFSLQVNWIDNLSLGWLHNEPLD